MRTPESEFKDKVEKYLNSRRILSFRNNMGFYSGLPDMFAIYKGILIGLELKREDKKGVATSQQNATISLLKDAGAVAGLVDSISDVEELLKKAEEKLK